MDEHRKHVVTGVSQITISKKWVAICIAIMVVFTAVAGWMFQITATARPVTAEYAKEQLLK